MTRQAVIIKSRNDWHTDFTIAIGAHDLRAFKNAYIDWPSLVGKRVSGWVKRDCGPMITPADLHRLEIEP